MAIPFSLKKGFLANQKKNKANTAQLTIATNLDQRRVTPELLWAYGHLCPFQRETHTLLPITLWLLWTVEEIVLRQPFSCFLLLSNTWTSPGSRANQLVLPAPLTQTISTPCPGYSRQSVSWASACNMVRTTQSVVHQKTRTLKASY